MSDKHKSLSVPELASLFEANYISFNSPSNGCQIQNPIYEYGYYFNNDKNPYNNNSFNSFENDYNY